MTLLTKKQQEKYMNGYCPVFALYLIESFDRLELRYYNNEKGLGHHVLLYDSDTKTLFDARGKTNLKDLMTYFDDDHGWISDCYDLIFKEPSEFNNTLEEAEYVFSTFYNSKLEDLRELKEYQLLFKYDSEHAYITGIYKKE